MHIVVGSTNPVKNAAVENVLRLVFSGAHFSGRDVPSGVPSQPWGDAETRAGAFNRAQAALAIPDAEIGVGLEGGVMETEFGLMTCAWCALLHRDGMLGLGGGSHLMLPVQAAALVRQGLELGQVIDQMTGQHNTKQRDGAIGFLTNGLLNRQQAYENLVRLAVAPFQQPDYYRGIP